MVRLRKLLKTDSGDLAQLANNRKIADCLRDIFPNPYNEGDAIEFIELCAKEKPQATFAIEFEDELAGVIGLVLQADIYSRSAELGYWLGESFWNKGIATKAAQQIIGYAFEELKLIRLYSGVFENNMASRKVLEKCGFMKEGILRKAVVKNNQVMDELRFALINPEFE